MGFPKWHAMKAIMRGSKATANDRMVAVALVMHSDNGGRCFPSIELLAEETGCSRSSVMRSVGRLEKGIEGLPIVIARRWRKGQWGRRSRHYELRLGNVILAEAKKSNNFFENEELDHDSDTQESVTVIPPVEATKAQSEGKAPKSLDSNSNSDVSKGVSLCDSLVAPTSPGSVTVTPPGSIRVTPSGSVTVTPEEYNEVYTEDPDPDPLSVCDLRSHTSVEKPKPPSRQEGGAGESSNSTNESTRLTKEDLVEWDPEPEPETGPRQLRLDGSVEPSAKEAVLADMSRVWDRYIEHWHREVGRGPVPKRSRKRAGQIKQRNSEFGVDMVIRAVDTLFRKDSYWFLHNHTAIQYAIRSTEQTEKVLTKAAELDDPTMRRSPQVPTATRYASGDNAPVQMPPEGHTGYRAKITYTEDGAFDREGNEVHDPQLEQDADRFRRKIAERKAQRKAQTDRPKLSVVAEA